MLIFAIIAITAALVFYTVGVFWERKSRCVKGIHTVIFWLGFACDTTGTLIMSQIARVSNTEGLIPFIHGFTGGLAIALMLFHAVWATIVVVMKKQSMQKNFHKFSIVVWAIWLIPYIIGMIIGMM